jgi:hypothetical protein
MSLFDMILGQKLILLSLAVSIAPLLAAALILLVSRLKRRLAGRARSRRVLMAQQQRQAAVEVPGENVVPPQSGGQSVQPGAAPPVPLSPEEQPSEEQPQVEPASAVQDILSSVFTDGDASEQYAALLQTIEDVDVTQLAAMCSQVGDQLRISRSPATPD